MSIRAAMREAASGARVTLEHSADAVVGFLNERLCPDGGFAGRGTSSDLYYTVFALAALEALGAELPAATAGFLRGFGDGGRLDLVHLASLARCWAVLPDAGPDEPARGAIEGSLLRLRCPCGGYSNLPEGRAPTAYGCFLALGALQDLGAEPAAAADLGECIERTRSADGAYANAPGLPVGSTCATAAAVVALRQLDRTVAPEVVPWLLSQRRGGGFIAMPGAPVPDLLSTATALHALAALGSPPGAAGEQCLDFVEGLWTGGGFVGHWADRTADCEYTFYGLLALGHLAG